MIKRILITMAGMLMLAGCSGGGNFTVKGHIEGLTTNQVTLLLNDEVIATGDVADGTFTLKGEVDEPSRAMLCIDKQPFVAVYLDGSNIRVEGTWGDEIWVTGTPANDAATAYNKAYNELVNRYMAAETDADRDAISQENETLSTTTMQANNDNLFGLELLSRDTYSLSGSDILKKLSLFPAKIRNTQKGMELNELALAQQKSEPGSTYIEAVLPDKDGNEIKLSDYVGKGYVLVDFWASWCGPCMAELPYLLDSYAKYHDKGFEIFGISLDRHKEEWLAAVREHNMNWIHTARLMNPETTVTKDYSVQAIPSNFLIDPQGVIIAKNLRGEEVAAKLKELLD